MYIANSFFATDAVRKRTGKRDRGFSPISKLKTKINLSQTSKNATKFRKIGEMQNVAKRKTHGRNLPKLGGVARAIQLVGARYLAGGGGEVFDGGVPPFRLVGYYSRLDDFVDVPGKTEEGRAPPLSRGAPPTPPV